MSLPSTLPSRPPPPRARRRLGALLIVAVLVVGSAEAATRWLEPALPRPAGWPDEATATKVAQLEDLEATGCTDVVFVGNSMARDDLVPREFTAADPLDRAAYNASLDAASPELLRRWVDDEVLPATEPALVVIGVASFDLNDEASTPAAALRAWDEAPYTATGLDGTLEEAFTRHVALVRNRTALREPSTVVEAVGDRLAGERADRPDADGIDGVLAPDGHGLSRRSLEFTADPATIARLRGQFLTPFDLGGRQANALRQLVDDVTETGAAVAVVVLPVTDEYAEAHPDGRRDVDAFRRLLETALDGSAATIIDTPDSPPTAFADTHHLDGGGADAFTAALPGLLDEAGVPARSCGVP